MTRDMWMDDIARIEEEFRSEKLTLGEGIKELTRLGLDADEAETLLKEAIA